MRYIVDRLEESLAVCENEQKEIITISRDVLPREVMEGDVLQEQDGIYSRDEESTRDRRQEMKKKLMGLFEQ